MIRARSLDVDTQGSLLAVLSESVAAFAAVGDYLEGLADVVDPEIAEPMQDLIEAISGIASDTTEALVVAETQRVDDSLIAVGDVVDFDGGPYRVLGVTGAWVVLDPGAGRPRVEPRAAVEELVAASSTGDRR